MGLLSFALAAASAFQAQPAPAPPPALNPPTRLFSSDQPIRFTLSGPIRAIAAAAERSRAARPAKLALAWPVAEEHPILLSARGLTRRKRETCEFPPLRVELTARPPPTSLFERQRRLKLVTHCRSSSAFQQQVLLEYAAYRLFNVISRHSLRARLATVGYADDSGRAVVTRTGFLLEDVDDAASRNGMKQLNIASAIAASRLSNLDAARVAVFEYMIGNLDWSMRAGPPGADCCHNVELIARAPGAPLIPVPYDFDFSGLVNAPYAVPPDEIRVRSVRERHYRGHCIHNAQAIAAAAEFRSRRGELLAVLASVPGLEEKRRAGAAAYLETFFRDIADDESVRKRLLGTCIG